MPSIEALNQELRRTIAVQYSDQFGHAVSVFFDIGDRKKRPNKSVDHLTTLLRMFMCAAAEDRGLDPNKMQMVKYLCKEIATAIKESPTLTDMVQACRDHMMNQRRELAMYNATSRVWTAIYHLCNQCQAEACLERVFTHAIIGNFSNHTHQFIDVADIVFVDVADMLLELGHGGTTTSCT